MSKLNKTTQERIKADAEAKYPLAASHTITDGPRAGYIAGATAEHERVRPAIDTLEQIANSPVPANQREMAEWVATARVLAIAAIEQWEGEKEVNNG